MGRRRDSDESEDEGSEEYDSYDEESDASGTQSGSGSEEYDSEEESGSGDEYDSEDGYDSEDDEDAIKNALKDAGMKKHFKTLSKKGYTESISKAQKLDDKKLEKLGIDSSSDRKKILKALEGLGEDGDSDADEATKIHKILKANDQKKAVKYFEKYNITTFKKAKKLDDSKLKKLGVSDAKARKKIIKAFAKEATAVDAKLQSALKKAGLKDYISTVAENDLAGKKVDEKDLKGADVAKEDRKKLAKVLNKHAPDESGSEEESGSESDDDADVVKKLLNKANMKKYYPLFETKGIDSIEKAKALQHKDLREMGIHLYRERRDIIEEFEKYNGEELPSASTGSEEEEGDNVNMVHEVLRQQYMSRHIPDFDRMGITTLRQARKLTQTQLRSMGVALYLQRERLINAFADYRPKNKAIMKILVDCNLASHAREFEKLIDVEDAKNLTHSDLRAMGINLYGQRERLLRAFMEYKPKGK